MERIKSAVRLEKRLKSKEEGRLGDGRWEMGAMKVVKVVKMENREEGEGESRLEELPAQVIRKYPHSQCILASSPILILALAFLPDSISIPSHERR